MPTATGAARAREPAPHREAGTTAVDEARVRVIVEVDPVILEEARERIGIDDPVELLEYALISLARPDPARDFLIKNYGALGPDHDLDIR